MPRRAIPKYMDSDTRSSSLGMRFNMYLPIWKNNWRKEDKQKLEQLEKIVQLKPMDKKIMQAWQKRQHFLAHALPTEQVLQFTAKTNAPLSTGLGNAHPLENGFAFLWPYGLPYLPGSSIKGVLRQAAEQWLAEQDESQLLPQIEVLEAKLQELKILLDKKGYKRSDIILHALFGLKDEEKKPIDQKENEKFQGLVRFLDSLPQFEQMQIEIMNPHYGDYYRGKTAPHDSGQPIPIYFLTLPLGTKFCFTLIYDALRGPAWDWQTLMKEIIQYSFDYLGFGAKTALGYGAFDQQSIQININQDIDI